MGKRRKGRSVEIKLLIPERIYLEFERELTQNFSQRPAYGARSQIVTQLITEWLAKGKETTPHDEGA